MRINQNIAALNAWRNLNINQNALSKSLERLSSGLRINRAADDAAGLAISEKMRGQVRGLNMAAKNAQDAISLIQTAEGALNETHSILQRMRELAVQSASDTNTDKDRAELQKEIDQLAQELSRIASDTEFNTQKLLDGRFEGTFHIGANQGQSIAVSIGNMSAEALKVVSSGAQIDVSFSKSFDPSGATPLALSDGSHEYNVVEIEEQDVDSVTGAKYGLTNEDGKVVAVSVDGSLYTVLQDAVALDELDTAAVASDGAGTITLDFTHAVKTGTVAIVYDDSTLAIFATAIASLDVNPDALLPSGTYKVVDDSFRGVEEGELGLVNEKGELVAVALKETGPKVFVSVSDLKTVVLESIGAFEEGDQINISPNGGIDVSSQEAADRAITIINDAIEVVSAERSKLGALQNRLEHTIQNLGVAAENLQAAESRIRDADMAREMSEFTRAQILQQASTAMLAQANLVPQTVLQLLG